MKYIFDDYGNKVTEARKFPCGADGNIICGISGYLEILEGRLNHNAQNPNDKLPTPKWEDLKVYWKNGKYY